MLLRSRPRVASEWESDRAPLGGDAQPIESDRTAEFRPWRPSRRLRLLLLANFGMASFYLTWWLAPGHAGTPILFYLLAAAEAFNLLHLLGLWWAIWATKVDPPPQHRTQFSVDVFIPTYGEPLHVLARTIRAAVAMDEPHTTYVLDDANNRDVKVLAERLGAEYMARTNNRGAKAGNLNNALRQTTGELFAIFDADHVPRKDFLKRILGYFEDATVGFVQTPQYYGNSSENEVARNAYQQQAIFYGPIMRGKNGMAAAFCCGTNVIFRRAAIDEVGGFDKKSVVEDFVTSMRIHRRGWRSVYYPYILAEGLGPSSLRAYFRQQFRWARGSIGSLLSLEPFKPGFAIGQRFQYLLASTWYLIGLVTVIYMMLPILYLLGGWSPFSNHSASFLLFYGPYVLLALVTIRWGLGHQLRFEHLRYTYGSFPVYTAAALASILHLPARFQVTSKSEGRSERPPVLAYVVIFAFLTMILSIIVGLLLRPIGARTITNISWAIVNLLLMHGIVGAVVRERRARRNPASARYRETLMLARSLRPIAGGASRVADGRRLMLPEFAVPSDLSPQSTRAGSMPAWQQVAILTLLGLALRTLLINVPGLRGDESLSLLQVRSHSLIGLWKYLVTANVHVPLYHTILFFWIKIVGTSEWAIRVPSVIFGTACIPLLYVVGKRLVGHRAGVVAAAIGAASPFWVWHSDEARMYPLLLVLILASMAMLFQAVDKGGFWRWAAFAVVTGLSLYSHYFALLMPLVQGAYLLIHRVDRRKILAWIASMAAVGLTFLPWVWALYTERVSTAGVASITNGIHIQNAHASNVFSVVAGFFVFFLVFVIGYHATAIFTVLSGFVLGTWPLAAHFTVVSRRIAPRLRSRTTMFLLAWLVLTVGAVFVLNLWKEGLWFQRYLIIASPPLFLLLARGLSRLLGRWTSGALVLFAALAAISVAVNFEQSNPVQEDFRQVATVMKHSGSSRDGLLVLPAFEAVPMRYYLSGQIQVASYDVPTETIVQKFLPLLSAAHRNGSMWLLTDNVYEETADRHQSKAVLKYLTRRYPGTGACKFGRLTLLRFRLDDLASPSPTALSCAAPVPLLAAGPSLQVSPGLAWFMVAINLLCLLGIAGSYIARRRSYRKQLAETARELSMAVPGNGGSSPVPPAHSGDPQVQRRAGVTTSDRPGTLQVGGTGVTRPAGVPNASPTGPVRPPVPDAEATRPMPHTDGDIAARLSDPDPFRRLSAIGALRGLPESDQVLIRALRDEYPLVRREAVRALRDVGSQSATEALIQVAGHDPSAEVREEAVAALGALIRERHGRTF